MDADLDPNAVSRANFLQRIQQAATELRSVDKRALNLRRMTKHSHTEVRGAKRRGEIVECARPFYLPPKSPH